jgi:hypothetical protein
MFGIPNICSMIRTYSPGSRFTLLRFPGRHHRDGYHGCVYSAADARDVVASAGVVVARIRTTLD